MQKAKINEVIIKGDNLEELAESLSYLSKMKADDKIMTDNRGSSIMAAYYLVTIVWVTPEIKECTELRIIKIPQIQADSESYRNELVLKLVRDRFSINSVKDIQAERIILDLWDQKVIAQL